MFENGFIWVVASYLIAWGVGMGVFDYVVLSDELKERLGRYGEENYQTKYVIEGGFISVL